MEWHLGVPTLATEVTTGIVTDVSTLVGDDWNCDLFILEYPLISAFLASDFNCSIVILFLCVATFRDIFLMLEVTFFESNSSDSSDLDADSEKYSSSSVVIH